MLIIITILCTKIYNKMIYTFSPNWYKPQCLHFRSTHLYYCSNYLLYQYDLGEKRVMRELCLRQMALQNNINHKDIKINAISSNQKYLIVGINQAYLVLVWRESLSVAWLVPLQGFQAVEYIYPYRQEGEDVVILCSKDGYFAKYSFGEVLDNRLEKIEIRHKLSGVKAIYSIRNHHFAVFTRGTILLYNQDFTKLEKVVEVSHSDTIFSVDSFQEGEKIFFAFLTKSKESHQMTLFEFNFKEEFPLQVKKKIEEIGDNVKRFEVNMVYPKKFSQKLKNSQKASMTIKLLSPDDIVLTGKFGEIVTIHSKLIKDRDSLVIKPYSNQEGEVQYTCWSDSRHYKEIYFIYGHLDRLYAVSTDHNLTIWQVQGKSETKYLYSIKFLTAPVQNFFYSESDPRNLFALLKDSAVRSFTPLEKGGNQINEYWKFSKKYRIKKAMCHPLEQGVLCLSTECNKVQLYDIFEDRLMKLIEFEQEILNVSFEFGSIEQQLEQMFKYEMKEAKLQYVSHFAKEMDNKTVIFVQTKQFVFVIKNIAEKEVVVVRGKRERRLERIHLNRFWDGHLLLASQAKQNNLELFIRFEGKTIVGQAQLTYQQGRVMFKSERNSKLLSVINFKGAKFAIIRCKINGEEGRVEVLGSTEIILNHQIDYLHINYADWRVAVYSQRDDAIIVLSLDRFNEAKYEINKQSGSARIYEISTKIDTLCFYLEEFLVVGTKDQSIKVIQYGKLEQWRAVKKKQIAKDIKVEQKNKIKIEQKRETAMKQKNELPIEQKKESPIEQKNETKVEQTEIIKKQ